MTVENSAARVSQNFGHSPIANGCPPRSEAQKCRFKPCVSSVPVQASTMRILDRYIREGAPLHVSLSESCRAEILASKASSAHIFQRAREEVMIKLGGDQLAYCVSVPKPKSRFVDACHGTCMAPSIEFFPPILILRSCVERGFGQKKVWLLGPRLGAKHLRVRNVCSARCSHGHASLEKTILHFHLRCRPLTDNNCNSWLSQGIIPDRCPLLPPIFRADRHPRQPRRFPTKECSWAAPGVAAVAILGYLY